MIPKTISQSREIKIKEYFDDTWQIDFATKRVHKVISGLDAVTQAIEIILRTERYKWYIYSPDFGVELFDLLGKRQDYVETELERRLKEALMVDDRILDITDFNITKSQGNKVGYQASFNAVTKYGTVGTKAVI